MSITDELRSWAARRLAGWKMLREEHDELTAIADRIDAEHEAKVSYWQGASYKDGYDEGFASADDWLAQHEDAMAEHGWIRLPKDADGVPIHVGDEVEEIDCDGGHRVVELRMCESGWWVTANGICRRPHKYRHYHAPTVEDVLREFASDIADVLGGDDFRLDDSDELFAEYAAKLWLAEREDA